MMVRRAISILALVSMTACGSRPANTSEPPASPDLAAHPTSTTTNSTSPCLGEGESALDERSRFPDAGVAACCEPLVRVSAYEARTGEAGACLVSKADRFVCTRCGDGICGPGEDRCNCQDC